VATAVRRRSGQRVEPTASVEALARLLENDQFAAASMATAALLTVIAGGPGTGKTHTVAALLAAELAGAPGLRVGLAAPTGKAASRLTEAVAATGLQATTVHRLLRRAPDSSTRFRHDADHPLELDLLVVDETSMLALPLTARLLAAVPDGCRLVLVGDPDQLNSIEVGAVLADLVAADERDRSLGGQVVRLVRQHRVGADSPIAPLAEAIRRGDAEAAVELLRDGGDARLQFVEVADGSVSADAADAVMSAVAPAYDTARVAALAGDRDAAFTAAVTARVLCAHRRGSFGASAWNELVESRLGGTGSGAFAGRPLLATRNDPRTGLANGDPGVLVDGATAARAAFRRGGELVTFDLAELDAVDTAYALTVHKSQGSQYDTVALVHPPATSPLVSRELLYTAVTRASSRLLVVASAAAIRRAVTTPTRRVTGLAAALSSDDAS
jgi:exodeoxyribonuclease V alpha subunit